MEATARGIVALIPARGGSKSIPFKNIALMAGRPLIYWVLDAAISSHWIDRVYVATDSDSIAEIVSAYPSDRIEVIARSEETATDTASTESIMLEFSQMHSFDHLVLIQATSPLLMVDDLNAGIERYLRQEADGLVSVVSQKRFFWKEGLDGWAVPINYDPGSRPRRQDFYGQLVENGAFYICGRERLLATGSRLSGRIIAYRMPEETYFEIDEPSDWTIVEGLLRQRGTLSGDLSRIKLFLTDVDGVMTDAGMYYSETGDELKKFNTRDGKGIELLRHCGVLTGIITGENTAIVANRARKLRFDYLFQGISNKLEILEQLLRETGIRPEEVAYIGDDINDLEVLQRVGFSAAPSDAMPAVREVVHHVCAAKGGEGCVREVCERIVLALANRHSVAR